MSNGKNIVAFVKPSSREKRELLVTEGTSAMSMLLKPFKIIADGINELRMETPEQALKSM